jgi:Cof subfamily protein (haloacid dehalogenase superfamily)
MTTVRVDGVRRPPFRFGLVAIDIDDTLVGPDKRISENNHAAVTRLLSMGCRVVLASGREHSSMRLFHDALGLDEYLVSSQGALVVHPRDGHELWHRPVDGTMAQHLVETGRALGADVLLYTRHGIFAAPDSPWILGDRQAVDTSLRFHAGDLQALAAAAPLKVLWYGTASHVARWAVESERYATSAEIVLTAPELLEFNAPDATKATAIEAVAAHYGIAQHEVLAFGDGLNDVALLRWAGCGVAVGHASDVVRASADVVVPEGDVATSLARGIHALIDGVVSRT